MTKQGNNLPIHLIGPKNKNQWDPIWKNCFKFWESSSYNIKLWNDEEDIDNLLKEDDLSFFNILQTIPKIFKLDYARYVILEKFGGAYFDLDVEVKINFLPHLNLQKIYIMESSVPDEIVQNSIIVSLKTTKSSYFWDIVKNHSKSNIKNNLQTCKDYFSIIPFGTNVRKITGPLFLSKIYKIYSPKFNIELLSHLHFNKMPHGFKICYHHQTGNWGNDLTNF